MDRLQQSGTASNLWLRSEVIQAIRIFFRKNNYLEIETPCRIPAPAPEAHIEAQRAGDWYLQTSPELCMKEMLAAGFTHIFQICHSFRKNERGHHHLPEFTILEWYAAGSNYFDMMCQCEDLIRFTAQHLNYQDQSIDLQTPWPRMTVHQAFERFASLSVDAAFSQNKFDQCMALEIEPQIDQSRPLFLYDYPAEAASLARLKPENHNLAERFELYMGGMEICNAFSELSDAQEQRARFQKELKECQKNKRTVGPMPEQFLKILPNMPPAAGNALGVDRLVMLMANAATIDEVSAFVPVP